MSNGFSDNLKGAANQLKGDVKEKVGSATNDPSLQTEGKLDKLKGTVQEKVGDVKEALSNKLDDLSNKN